MTTIHVVVEMVLATCETWSTRRAQTPRAPELLVAIARYHVEQIAVYRLRFRRVQFPEHLRAPPIANARRAMRFALLFWWREYTRLRARANPSRARRITWEPRKKLFSSRARNECRRWHRSTTRHVGGPPQCMCRQSASGCMGTTRATECAISSGGPDALP